MRLHTFFLIMLGLIVGGCSGSGLKPTMLRCEYLNNPLGIDVPNPRLTWVLESGQRGAKQTAYQVLVATSPKAMEKPDLWDSGKVQSDQTMHIAYAGRSLKSFERAYWQVRVWDQKDQPSALSERAFFEMGFMNPLDLKAQWISTQLVEAPASQPAIPQGDPAPMFRKRFDLNKPIASARVYICGLGYYDLWINGQRISDHVLDPAYTQYNKRVLYVTHDVTKALKTGPNAVGVILGDGFYNQWAPDVWHFEKAPWRARPRLLAEVHVTFEDGSKQVIPTDTTWKVGTGAIIQSTARTGEIYDARKEVAGWTWPDFNDVPWNKVVAMKPTGAILRAQMMPPMKVMQTLRPISVKQPKPGLYLFDMGQNMTGWARLKGLRGVAGTKIILRFGERVNADGTLDQSNLNTFINKQLFQMDSYTMKGGGEETWEPRFTYHGFQYVQVESPIPLTAENLDGRVVHTAFEKVGSFECSDPVINKLQYMTVWSYIGNFQAIPTDCPQREKNGWTGDAHLAAECAMYNFENAAGYTAWTNSVGDAQFDDGFIPDVVPDPKWTMNAGPAWESVYILIPWYMYQYNGDTRLLTRHYNGMVKLMNRFASKAKDNVLYYGLNDWVAIQKTPAEYTVTSYYYLDALIMAKTAAMLGKTQDAAKYEQLAKDIRAAYNRTLFENGLSKAKTQTAQATALYQGLAEDTDREAVFKNLLDLLHANKDHPNTGVFGAHYLPTVLTQNGQLDLAMKMLTQPTGPGWGEWVAMGFTTLQENWGRGDSQNHIFFGHISTWFYNTLAGIRLDPQQPAWKHIIIKPYTPTNMTFVKAKTRTIRGEIVSSWKKERNRFTLDITIPPNTTATVYLPAGANAKIEQNGRTLKQVQREGDRAVIDVESGEYSFTVD